MMMTYDDDDNDDDSMSSETTLGNTSVDLLLNFSRRRTGDGNDNDTNNAISNTPVQHHRSNKNEVKITEGETIDSSTGTTSGGSAVSPPTQIMNELSNASNNNNNNSNTAADDLMYDMSQLSQIPINDSQFHRQLGINSNVNSNSKPVTVRAKSKTVSKKAAPQKTPAPVPLITNTKKATPNSTSTSNSKSTYSILALPQPTSFGMNVTKYPNTSTVFISDLKMGGQAYSHGFQIGDVLHHVPSHFHSKETGHWNLNLNCNTKEKERLAKESLERLTMALSREQQRQRHQQVDLDLKTVPVQMEEIREWSDSMVRPVFILVERGVDIDVDVDVDVDMDMGQHGKEATASSSTATAAVAGRTVETTAPATSYACSISKAQLKNALQGKGYPKIPCCRKCHDSQGGGTHTMGIKNHHFLCPKHAQFDESGAKDKLTILMAGALMECEACGYELEHGKKSGSGSGSGSGVVHNAVCIENSGKGKGAGKGMDKGKVKGKGKGKCKVGAGTGSHSKGIGKSTVVQTPKGGGKAKAAGTGTRTVTDNGTNAKQPKKVTVPGKSIAASSSKKTSTSSSALTSQQRKRKSVAVAVAADKGPAKKVTIGKQGVGASGMDENEMFQSPTPLHKTQTQTNEGQMINSNHVSRTPIDGSVQRKQGESREKTQDSVQVTPATTHVASNKNQDVGQRSCPPLILTEDQSVSKWVPCPNPWGDRTHCDGDFVLFSPEDYACAFEIYGSNPKRFTMYPFRGDCYQQTHVSQKEGGLSVIQLIRDRLALRSWGFRFCFHDFGGACLITEVEPMSPADSATSVDGNGDDARLKRNDMIICVNNKKVGGMTEIEFGVLLDTSGPELFLVVARYKESEHERKKASLVAALSLSEEEIVPLHWNDIGLDRTTKKCSSLRKISMDNMSQRELEPVTVNGQNVDKVSKKRMEEMFSDNDDCRSDQSERNARVKGQSDDNGNGGKMEKRFPDVNDDRSDKLNMNASEIKKRILELELKDLPTHITPVISSRNEHGYKGVFETGGTLKAEVTFNKNSIRLYETFPTKVDAAKMAAWAHAIIQGEDETVELPRGEDETVELLVSNESTNVDKELSTKEKILNLKLEDMPPHILPIPSRRNKYGYHGVTNRDRKMTKFSCVVYMDAKAVRLGPYDSAEDASKMFAWAYLIKHGQDKYNELLGVRSQTKNEDSAAPNQEKESEDDCEMHVDHNECDTEMGRCLATEDIDIASDESGQNLPNELEEDNDLMQSSDTNIDDEDDEHQNLKHSSDTLDEPFPSKNTNYDTIGLSDHDTSYASLPSNAKDAKHNHSSLQESNDVEEPEWDDDSNPWLGCVCGETHESPMPVFWLQCDSCDAWFNCAAHCVGFSKEDAERKGDWKCTDCLPLDITAQDIKTNHADIPFAVGTVVDVEDRTWSGSNKPGGVARVLAHYIFSDYITYDVKYILESRTENVESQYISVNYDNMTTSFMSPSKSTRSS